MPEEAAEAEEAPDRLGHLPRAGQTPEEEAAGRMGLFLVGLPPAARGL